MLSEDFLGISHPGEKPKRPIKPRKPRTHSISLFSVWSSECPSCTLADILSRIPPSVPASSIKVIVEKNERGYPHTSVFYDKEIPNLEYEEQMIEYEKKILQFNEDIIQWELKCSEWQAHLEKYYDAVKDMHDYIIEEIARYGT